MSDVALRVADRRGAGLLSDFRGPEFGSSGSGLDGRMAAWLEQEGDRRTTWIASHRDDAHHFGAAGRGRARLRPRRPARQSLMRTIVLIANRAENRTVQRVRLRSMS